VSSGRWSSLYASLKKLPSIVWILIFVLGIIGFIGGIIGLFYLLSHVEGVASVIMLVVAWAVIRGAAKVTEGTTVGEKNSIFTALGIGFFALMGMAIDQPGNVLYNQPMQWFFCPSGTELHRGVVVTNPVPGQTNTSQDFTCVNQDTRQFEREITVPQIIGVRFGEYVLIGYALIGLSRVYDRLRQRSAPE
jgi:hypothetical protein